MKQRVTERAQTASARRFVPTARAPARGHTGRQVEQDL